MSWGRKLLFGAKVIGAIGQIGQAISNGIHAHRNYEYETRQEQYGRAFPPVRDRGPRPPPYPSEQHGRFRKDSD